MKTQGNRERGTGDRSARVEAAVPRKVIRGRIRRAGLVVAVVGALACGKSVVVDPAVRAAGEKVYRTEPCVGCHGEQRQGGRLAPPLAGLARHWDEEKLVRFLRDPVAFAQQDRRIRALAARYPSRMPPVNTSDPAKLRALAHYLLTD